MTLLFSDDLARFESETASKPGQWKFPIEAGVCFGGGLGIWTVFRNHHIFWVNRTDSFVGALVVPVDNPAEAHRTEARRLAYEFCHEVAFRCDCAVRVWGFGVGHNVRTSPSAWQPPLMPFLMGPPTIHDSYPRDSRVALAVGTYAEGLNSSEPSCFYSFLCFFKVMEISFGRDTGRQCAWINETVERLSGSFAGARVTELRQAGVSDCAAYLFRTNRCAIAHAARPREAADPNNPEDYYRVKRDLEVMKLLARKAILEVLHAPCA